MINSLTEKSEIKKDSSRLKSNFGKIKGKLSNVFFEKDKLKKKVDEQIHFIEEDKPFEDIIGPYGIEDLSGKNAKSGTAFQLTDKEGKKYKLRTAADKDEATNTDKIITSNKNTMPGYLGRREIGGRVYHLFKRLENAKEIKDFKYDYRNKDNEQEPDEIHKKAGKVLGKVNANIMHTNGAEFAEEFNIRTKKSINPGYTGIKSLPGCPK